MSKNLIDEIKSTIVLIGTKLDSIVFNLKLEQINKIQQSDVVYMSKIFCNDNGDYNIKEKKCDCDVAFFGIHCNESGLKYWNSGWTSFQVIIAIFYIVLAILTCYSLHLYLKEEYGSFWKKIHRIISTPKYLVILNLIVICTSKLSIYIIARIVFIVVDPLKQRKIFNRVTDRILYELIFSASISIFFILLLVWMGLYSAFNIQNSLATLKPKGTNEKDKNVAPSFRICWFRHYYTFKILIISVLFFVYPIQIIFSYFRSIRSHEIEIIQTFMAVVIGLFLFCVFLFIYYTCKLKYKLSQSYEAPTNKSRNNNFVRKSKTGMLRRENKKIEKEDIKQFLKEVDEKSIVNLVVRYIVNTDSEKFNSGEDSDLELDYEDEMRNIDLNFFENENHDEKNDIVPEANSGNDRSENDLIEDDKIEVANNDDSPINVDGIKYQVKEIKLQSSAENNNLISSDNINPKSNKPNRRTIDFSLTRNDMRVLNKVKV
jgi:hypothetical protein